MVLFSAGIKRGSKGVCGCREKGMSHLTLSKWLFYTKLWNTPLKDSSLKACIFERVSVWIELFCVFVNKVALFFSQVQTVSMTIWRTWLVIVHGQSWSTAGFMWPPLFVWWVLKWATFTDTILLSMGPWVAVLYTYILHYYVFLDLKG